MNILQVNPDGSRERRAIPDEWTHSYDVPVREPFHAFREQRDDLSRVAIKTLRYRNSGLEVDGRYVVFLTDAHQLDLARIEMSFPVMEPRSSAETHLRNEMIEFIRSNGIDRRDVLAERFVDIDNPHGEPKELIYSLRIEWPTLKARQ